MLKAMTCVLRGLWRAGGQCDTVTRPYDDRYRRRQRLIADGGLEFLLDLPHAQVLRDGDGLQLDDGSIVAVRAADEDLVEVTAPSSAHLARLAWHLGNRHLPAAIGETRILIRSDHVIENMLRGLGGEVRAVRGPFEPEAGEAP